jgi:glutathione-independent formaldehyde dehydrogenase
VGDLNKERLAQAKSFGCRTVDLTLSDAIEVQIENILGEPFVDSAVDCVGTYNGLKQMLTT